MSENKITKYETIVLLKEKYAEILASGEKRFPKRSDFSEKEVVAIKAFLGPWPRALELAGIKEPRDDDKAKKMKEKRILAKRRKTALLKEQKKQKTNEKRS